MRHQWSRGDFTMHARDSPMQLNTIPEGAKEGKADRDARVQDDTARGADSAAAALGLTGSPSNDGGKPEADLALPIPPAQPDTPLVSFPATTSLSRRPEDSARGMHQMVSSAKHSQLASEGLLTPAQEVS